MRDAQSPQLDCGASRETVRRICAWIVALAFGCLGAAVASSMFAAHPAFAESSNARVTTSPLDAKLNNQKVSGAQIFGDVQAPRKAQPLYLQGDQLIYDTPNNKVVARGNVEIFYDNYILTADEVAYDQSAGTLTAIGNVAVKEPNGNIIRADRYVLTDDFRDGFVQSLSVVSKDETRIAAERATRRDGNVTEFQNGKFTPCKTEGNAPPLWCIAASRIVHDQTAQTISYEDAQFEVLGVPILYLPYFEHADPSVKRKSGFLVPDIGSSTNLGFFTEIPYYFALAQNYDFTFNPLYSSQQGALYKGEFRHRLSNGQYTVKFAAIDQNVGQLPENLQDEDRDGWQGSVQTKGLFSLSSWWKFGWDATFESSDYFRRFYGLDSVLLTDRVNSVFLTGQSDRNYFGATLYQFGGLTFDDTAQSESRAHPIIDYNYVFADPVLGGELKWDSNFLSFSRDDATKGIADQDVTRAITELKWRRRLTDSVGITYTPFANLRGDIYQFNNFTDPESDPLNPVTIEEDTTIRGLAEGGATVAYPWVANTASASHVIEPIGQIVTRQKSVTQRRLPDEDAKSIVFDDTNLFETQKFSGYDRIETGTRANVGLQYTFQSNTGGYARLLAGQSFHLDGDNVYKDPGFDDDGNPLYSPSSGLQTDRSDYVIGAYLAPTDYFRVISQSRFDEKDLSLLREDLGAQVSLGPVNFQTTYAFSRADPEAPVGDTLEEIFAVAQLQLSANWSIAAAGRYDLTESRVLQDSFQVRYADDCFVLTTTYSEQFFDDETIDQGRTVMVRFELKNIGAYNYKTDALDHVFGDQAVQN